MKELISCIKNLPKHFKESLVNLWRNGAMSFSSIFAVTITLLLIGVISVLALTLRAAGEKERAHTCSHTDTGGAHVTFNVIHRIIDRHTGRYRTTRAVDVKVDVLIRILGLQEKKLCNNKACCHVIYFLPEENDTVF